MRIGGVLVAVALIAAAGAASAADTLAKVKETGQFLIGFREDARPFAYRDEAGEPAGYSVDLCRLIAEGVKNYVELDEMAVAD